MFDITHVSRSDSFPRKIEVQEYRAPTDDSIRLFDEFKEKARTEIAKSYVFDNPNEISGMAISYEVDSISASRKIYIRFVLNGKEIMYSYSMKESMKKNAVNKTEMLREIAQGLAIEIVSKLADSGEILK